MTTPNGKGLSCSVGPLFEWSYDSRIGLKLTSSSSEGRWGGVAASGKWETQLELGTQSRALFVMLFMEKKSIKDKNPMPLFLERA